MESWIGPAALAVVAVAGLSWFGFTHLEHRCLRPDVTDALAGQIRQGNSPVGVLISNAHLASGQLFSFPYECEADSTPLRSGIDLSAQAWTHVKFEVLKVAGKLDVKILGSTS